MLHKTRSLKVELAVIVDARKPFVEATYKLEGDSILALECYEIISSLGVSVKMENYPNVHVSIADGKTDIQLKWMRHAISFIKPALDYNSEHLKADLMSIPLKALEVYLEASIMMQYKYNKNN